MTEEDEEFNRIERESAMRQESVRATMLAEQPAQQLVDCHVTGVCVQSGLRAEQPAQQEPVSGVVIREGMPTLLRDRDIKPTDARLYTSPPAQRTWVGLLWGNLPEDGQNHDFLRGAVWAEAKLKELNT